MRIISTIEDDGVLEGYSYLFACDYARGSAGQFDFTMNERQARLDAEKRQARLDAEREVRANEEKVRSLRRQLKAAQRDLDASERKLDALPR
jgi:predicted RNase H-like nuclease